jgi:hypothetical protein
MINQRILADAETVKVKAEHRDRFEHMIQKQQNHGCKLRSLKV